MNNTAKAACGSADTIDTFLCSALPDHQSCGAKETMSTARARLAGQARVLRGDGGDKEAVDVIGQMD